ncbi:hypothetical protein PSA7680_01153 [Pseudoruegeria aquimaris]|uniref:Transferrin-binding protein B C-lobe/N-lobe beta barrel domain-containing protein n=1 Tax=Pseudoruegeria aquimaris TaxID=393663 RepID=A0A1Y5RVT1_9RHOB|nr:hypothetical protein [Pseudoruegeria aquimaris]SLN26422.1 hypothetical protein PSA7680_01153 [Pseudoruegeria aquimaris]
MAHHRAPLILAAALAAVTACTGPSTEDGDGSSDTFTGEGLLLPGTENPTADADILRYEEDGSVSTVSYNAGADTFTVDNLPFDGDGVYDRDDVVASLNGFNVYENNNLTERRAYKALHGTSASGKTSVSIIRTGSYNGYGFGGFVYTRDGRVNLPRSGQATFTGQYAGTRVFEGMGGQQYTTGDAVLEVDFSDFAATNAVEGAIINRQVFDLNGNPVTLFENDGVTAYSLPTLVLATGSITTAGEIVGTASSERVPAGGTTSSTFEEGNYYAVIAGDDAEEIAGVIVVTSSDPQTGNGVQETGGFFVYD